MRYNDVLFLNTETVTEDEYGQESHTVAQRKVFANKFVVSGQERLTAGQLGIQPDLAFQIRSVEYHDEQSFIWRSKSYNIYRVSQNGDNTVIYANREVV